MVLLNDLLEEAATRTLELAQQAEEAHAVIESVAQRAVQLSNKVGAEGGDAHQNLPQVAEALDAAAVRLDRA